MLLWYSILSPAVPEYPDICIYNKRVYTLEFDQPENLWIGSKFFIENKSRVGSRESGWVTTFANSQFEE